MEYVDSDDDPENDNAKCKKCTKPTFAKEFSTTDRNDNRVWEGEEIPSGGENYCDATTGSPRLVKLPNLAFEYQQGGCKYESSPLYNKNGEEYAYGIGDECGLPTCRDAFGIPESGLNSRLPSGQTNSGIVRTALNDNSGIFWVGSACADIRPYNDQRCKTFFDRDDDNLGQYCSGASNMTDCGFYLTRTTGTVNGFTRCKGSSNTGDPTTDMQAACQNSTQAARCRNE